MSEKLSKDFVSYTRNVLPDWYDDFSDEAWRHTIRYIDSIQEKLDAKDKELEALRGFSKEALKFIYSKDSIIFKKAVKLGLIDESGNPTPLLKGDS